MSIRTRFHSLYLNILRDNLKLPAQNLGIGNNFIFYHDNDPKHTAQCSPVCLDNCPQVSEMPPQSPDLNPIEQIWRELVVRVRKHDIKTKSELINSNDGRMDKHLYRNYKKKVKIYSQTFKSCCQC